MNDTLFVKRVHFKEAHAQSANAHAFPQTQSSRMLSIQEVRSRLALFSGEESDRYKRANVERDQLEHVADPESFYDHCYERAQRMRIAITVRGMSDVESAILRRCDEEIMSWDPLVCEAAQRESEAIYAENEKRNGTAIRAEIQRFERDELPQIWAVYGADLERYQEYATRSYALEEEINWRRFTLRQWIPELQRDLDVIERAGLTHIKGIDEHATWCDIDQAIHECRQRIPEGARRTIDRQLQRERAIMNHTRYALARD
jgi:hypothetical protein